MAQEKIEKHGGGDSDEEFDDTGAAGQTLPRTIAAGETIQATLVIDASHAANSQVDVQGILTSTGGPARDDMVFSVVVVQPGTPAQPDLTVSLAGGFANVQ